MFFLLAETKYAILEMVRERIVEADNEGSLRYGAERRITPRQEMAYRLCHQDHCGLTVRNAADVMGVTAHSIRRLLREVESIAPQLFPVLPPRMARIYAMFVNDNNTIREIADALGITYRYVYRVLLRLHYDRKRTGLYFPSGTSRRLSYCNWMDPYIRTQW